MTLIAPHFSDELSDPEYIGGPWDGERGAVPLLAALAKQAAFRVARPVLDGQGDVIGQYVLEERCTPLEQLLTDAPCPLVWRWRRAG